MTDTRVTQLSAEVLMAPPVVRAEAKLTQASMEVLVSPEVATSAKLTQGAAEVMVSYTKAKLTQAVMEVMHDGVPQGRWVPFNTIL